MVLELLHVYPKKNNMFRSIFTIIVNWNLKEDLLTCISSIIETGFPPDQIIIVDNASSDGSIEAVKNKYEQRINLIQNDTNLGFSIGNNIGIERALQKGAQWCFLLNNDTVVSPLLFDEFSNVITNNPEYSIFSPIILNYFRPNMIWNSGNHLIPGTLITYSLIKGKIDKKDFPPLIPVDFITGCGMLIKAEVIENIGLFNPDLFMYGEDIEFCWRARQAGYKIACATKAKIWHKISASGKRNHYKSRYLRVRNQIFFYKKFSNIFQKPIMLIFSLLRVTLISSLDLIHKQPELIKASFLGFIDGWFNPDIWKKSGNYGKDHL